MIGRRESGDSRHRPRQLAPCRLHNPRVMERARAPVFRLEVRAALATLAVLSLGLSLAGCATRSGDVLPAVANPAEFSTWDCDHIADEIDRVQQRAADRAYAVDERAANNIIALGVGLTIFWPALVAMRTNGPDAEALAQLKGRYEALRRAAAVQTCSPPGAELPAARAAEWPLAVGEALVYEERRGPRGPAAEWALRLTALRRGEAEYRSELLPDLPPAASAASPASSPPVAPGGLWKQDLVGNVTASPDGALQWPRLLRGEQALGGVMAGDILVSGDPMARARVRGQVVAVGPQTVAGRRFDVAVIELFGDAQRGDVSTRLDGVIVIDRASGVLLRLDLRSAQPEFSLQRRLVRVANAARGPA
jgi:hypothetical protein